MAEVAGGPVQIRFRDYPSVRQWVGRPTGGFDSPARFTSVCVEALLAGNRAYPL